MTKFNFMKKGVFLWLVLVVSLVLIPLTSAKTLRIEKYAVNDNIITELKNPAEFNLVLTNLGESDTFQMYTLVGGVSMEEQTFQLDNGESKELTVKAYFDESVLKNRNAFGFEYRILGRESGIVKDALTVQVFTLGTAVSVTSENIQMNQKEVELTVKNRANYTFNDVNLKVSSPFFNAKYSLDLKPYEEKTFIVEINQEKLERSSRGPYILSYEIELDEVVGKGTSVFEFKEITNIKTEESEKGILWQRFISKKTNTGNSNAFVRVFVEKTGFARLFTSSNVRPSDVEKINSKTFLVFEKELAPGESVEFKITTNYWIPLILLIGLVVAFWLIFIEGRKCLVVKKKVAIIKTKGGEFALRITLLVRVLKNIERVSVIERIPQLVKLHKKFSIIEPTRIDKKTREVVWEFDALNAGEERIISYVIYSDIGVFGRFDIPAATIIYEREDKIYETESNKVVFYYREKSEKE